MTEGYSEAYTNAFLEACRSSDNGVIELLISSPKVELNGPKGLEALKLLTSEERMKDKFWQADAVSKMFLEACENDLGYRVEAVLKLDNQKVIGASDGDGRTGLMKASAGGCEHIVDMLLGSKHTDINAENEAGWNALMFAVGCNRPRVVERLLKREDLKLDTEIHYNLTYIDAATFARSRKHNEIAEMINREKFRRSDIPNVLRSVGSESKAPTRSRAVT